MTGWALIGTHPIQGRTFRRPLDGTERSLFWNGRFDGISDSLHSVELRLSNPSQDGHLFAQNNIVKAWLSTKRRYPLAAATIQLPSAGEGNDVPPDPHFIVREHDLTILRPNEIVFGQVACAEEVQERITDIFDGPRPLSDGLLVQLYVFRETSPERTDILHLMTLIAHCVTDGMANRTLMRCLLDTLARGGDSNAEPAQIPLEDRLVMVVSAEDLKPLHLRLLSPARRRWRRVIAAVIFRLRMAGSPGGHTLPCRHTASGSLTPARPGFASLTLTEAETSTVIANCRLCGITFGNAYLALSQVAMTRVLYRRYLHGKISEEEWEYRKRQPCITFCLLNLRPYLDREWFEKGGGGEFAAAIGFFIVVLPFMTLDKPEQRQCNGHNLVDGAPPLSELLTFSRFLHRTWLVKQQMNTFLSHPELVQALELALSCNMDPLALRGTKHVESAQCIDTHDNSDDGNEAPVVTSMVVSHHWSTLGDVHLIFPTEYPLPPTHSLSPFSPVPHPSKAGYVTPPPVTQMSMTTRIVVENAMTRLHVHPGELYLSALTSNGRLRMFVSYDGNMYDDDVVNEWLDEVRAAVLWYLGQTHRSTRGRMMQSGRVDN